jgi:hypothetical protein
LEQRRQAGNTGDDGQGLEQFDLIKSEFVGDSEANRMRSRAMRAPFTF